MAAALHHRCPPLTDMNGTQNSNSACFALSWKITESIIKTNGVHGNADNRGKNTVSSYVVSLCACVLCRVCETTNEASMHLKIKIKDGFRLVYRPISNIAKQTTV